MTPNNPMTEGEALAVDVGALHDAAKFLAGRYSDHDGWVVAIRAAASALTAAQQPVQEGGGECTKCRGTGEVCTGYIDGTPEMFDCTCPAAAPPSAPVGVEDKARAMFEAQADNLAAPWDRQWEPTKDFWRKCAAEALTQQPAQAAPGCTCPSGDGSLRWPCPTHPPGDDAAGGAK